MFIRNNKVSGEFRQPSYLLKDPVIHNSVAVLIFIEDWDRIPLEYVSVKTRHTKKELDLYIHKI